MGYLDVRAEAEKLFKKSEEMRLEEIVQVVAEIRAKMDQYGLTIEDIQGGKRARKAAGGSVVRYRGPNGEPWSGAGRQPGWLKDAMAKGAKKEDFEVK